MGGKNYSFIRITGKAERKTMSDKGKNLIKNNKGKKLYMVDPVKQDILSITTDHVQTLWLSQLDMDKMKGNRILIADDVISTGGSLHTLEEFVKMAGGIVAGKVTVLAEGEAAKRPDIIFLEELPVFPK